MSKQYTLKEIKKFIDNKGFILLSTEYKNNKSKLEIQCPKGHIYNVRYNNFQQGQKCPECAGNKKYTLEEIKKYIEGFNHKLLSEEYINNKTKLKFQCPNNHIFEMSYGHFQQNNRCPECFVNKKLTFSEIKEYIESFNYKLLSTGYKNAHIKLKLQCSEGHIYSVKYNDFQQGRRCPYCAVVKGWSKPEKEIAKYVKSIYFNEVVENDRTQVKNYWTGAGLELDIWIPEVKKAIEYNGSYWHNSDRTKWYDEMKVKQSIKKGINLLVIQEQDWYDNKNKCLCKINGLLND